MNCPHCGSDVPAGDAYCGTCRQEVTYEPIVEPQSIPVTATRSATGFDETRRAVRRRLAIGLLVLTCIGCLIFVPVPRRALLQRITGVQQAIEANVRTVPALLKMLETDDVRERIRAAEDLGDIGSTARAAVPRLIAMAASDDSQTARKVAATAIESIGSAAIPDLADALIKSPIVMTMDSTERERTERLCQLVAMEGLVTISHDLWRNHANAAEEHRAVATLIRSLYEGDRDVRASAALALGSIGPAAKEAVPRIMELVESENGLVRSRLEENTGIREEELLARHRFVRALGWIGPAASETLPLMIELWFNADNSGLFVNEVLGALLEIDPDGKRIVQLILENETWLTRSGSCIPLLDHLAQSPETHATIREIIPTVKELTTLRDQSLRREATKILLDQMEPSIDKVESAPLIK